MTTLYSPLMRQFRAINPADSREICRFCKQFEPKIANLSADEYFAIWTAFMQALHDIGGWGYLSTVCQEVMEYAIFENIKYYNGEDIYIKALYFKALAHYHLHQTGDAEEIAHSLLKMKPTTVRYQKLLHRCYMYSRPILIESIYAIGILGYFLSIVVAVVRLLYINPFAPFLGTWFDFLQWGFFMLSGATLLVGYLVHRHLAWKKVLKSNFIAPIP